MPAKKSKNPSVNAYLNSLIGPQKDVVLKLRSTILSVDSKIGEEIKWKNCLVFTYGGKNMIQTVVGKEHTTLIFFDGAKLRDPKKMLFGEGKTVRSARFPDVQIDVPSLQGLVKQELDLRK